MTRQWVTKPRNNCLYTYIYVLFLQVSHLQTGHTNYKVQKVCNLVNGVLLCKWNNIYF